MNISIKAMKIIKDKIKKSISTVWEDVSIMDKLVCPRCGSDQLRVYEERIITEVRKINKNNTISKRKKRYPISDPGASGIECLGCAEMCDYDMDNKGRIIEIILRR